MNGSVCPSICLSVCLFISVSVCPAHLFTPQPSKKVEGYYRHGPLCVCGGGGGGQTCGTLSPFKVLWNSLDLLLCTAGGKLALANASENLAR